MSACTGVLGKKFHSHVHHRHCRSYFTQQTTTFSLTHTHTRARDVHHMAHARAIAGCAHCQQILGPEAKTLCVFALHLDEKLEYIFEIFFPVIFRIYCVFVVKRKLSALLLVSFFFFWSYSTFAEISSSE